MSSELASVPSSTIVRIGLYHSYPGAYVRINMRKNVRFHEQKYQNMASAFVFIRQDANPIHQNGIVYGGFKLSVNALKQHILTYTQLTAYTLHINVVLRLPL